MPTIPIVPESTAAVPFAVTPSNITEAKMIAAYAEWDGTGASGNFLPCLAIYSNAGVRLGRVFPSSPVTAGDSAVVTYAPFPGGIGSQSSGGGIQFDTEPQSGDWLDVQTTGSISPGPSPLVAHGINLAPIFGVGLYGTDPNNGTCFDIQQSATGDSQGWNTVNVETDDNGIYSGSGPTGISVFAGVSTSASTAQAIIASCRGFGGWDGTGKSDMTAIIGGADALHGSKGNVVGIVAGASQAGAGDETALYCSTAGHQSGFHSRAIQAQDHTTADIFTVQDNGQVLMQKLPTSSAGLAAGSLWNNGGVVNIV